MANPSMATASTTPPPPTTAAQNSSPPPPQPSEPTSIVKQQKQPPQQPHFLNYIADLRNLSPALSAFYRRYDELHEHLDFIRTSIDAKLLQLLDTDPSPASAAPLAETLTVDELGKSDQSSQSEIETLCKNMCGRSLRSYIKANLSDVSRLRREVPSALKCASNPGKLVFECFGRFFLQGSKAYTKDSPMITSRQASVLVLEFFLLMGFESGEIEDAVRQEAEAAAVEWRRRLVIEGGLGKACETDARGLLLLIGCFGIPKAFKNEDIGDLIPASNVKEISDALRRSNVLVKRIPEVIEWMMKNKMAVEAVDVACTFEMEPEAILKSFLQEAKQSWKKTKNESQASLASVNRANRRQLADMKAVLKCVEHHKITPSKVLPGGKIHEKISKLERKIAELDKKIVEQAKPKRKSDEPESSNKLKSQEVKRPRFADHRPEQHVTAAYVDVKDPYEGLTQRNLLDGGMSGIPQYATYSAYPTVLRGAGDVLPSGSYAGVHGGILVDRVGQVSNNTVQPYGYAALSERLVGDERLVSGERLVGHYSFAEPSALGVSSSLYRATPSVEGFSGLRNPSSSIGVSSRSSATGTADLYQFADTIVERDTYASSRSGAAIPPRVEPAHHSSYYY